MFTSQKGISLLCSEVQIKWWVGKGNELEQHLGLYTMVNAHCFCDIEWWVFPVFHKEMFLCKIE